jgi:hypothetical protein
MMRTDPRPEEVRHLVAETLRDLGAAVNDWWDLDESILIDAGRYVARSYRTDGYLAMWLTDVGIVQFYNADGDMLATLNLFESLQPQRMAA